MSPTPFDHVRPRDADHPAGVYRVVGVGDETVTLLRIADADGTRRHTGETITVDAETFAGFAPAARPDRSRSVVSAVERGYWSIRAVGDELSARPLASTLSIALVLFGLLGGAVGPLPDLASGGLVLVGCLALAAVRRGRA